MNTSKTQKKLGAFKEVIKPIKRNIFKFDETIS